MHDGMPYDPIQGQGHGASAVPNALFQFTTGAGKWPLILKLEHNIQIWSGQVFYICCFLCHVTVNLEGSLHLARSQKSFSNFNEIWFVHRGRWLMHDGMPYDPIQGQSQYHRASEVPKIALFYVCLLRHLQWQLANDHWFLNYSTISKFSLAGFLLFVLVCVTWPWTLRGPCG